MPGLQRQLRSKLLFDLCPSKTYVNFSTDLKTSISELDGEKVYDITLAIDLRFRWEMEESWNDYNAILIWVAIKTKLPSNYKSVPALFGPFLHCTSHLLIIRRKHLQTNHAQLLSRL